MEEWRPAQLQRHREPVRVSIADQQHGLEEEDRSGPDGRGSTHEGKHHLGDHRLDEEEQKGACEKTDREYGKHRDRKRRLPLVKSRCRADQGGISWQADRAASARLRDPVPPVTRRQGKIAASRSVVHRVTAGSEHTLAALARSAVRSPAIRRLAVSLVGALAIAALPNAPANPSHVKIDPKLAATGPWFDRLNAWRASVSQSALIENTTFSAGDVLHATYIVQTGQITHGESTAYPQYTVAGDIAGQNSNMLVSPTTGTSNTQAIDWWVGAPFHAMAMMDPRLATTGFGSYRNSAYSWQMGAACHVGQGMTGSGSYPVYFPGNNSTEPLTPHSRNHFPDPTRACPRH